MGDNKTGKDFANFITAARTKKKTQDLADRILGKAARTKSSGSGLDKNSRNLIPAKGSLASRIQKRTASNPVPAIQRRNAAALESSLNRTRNVSTGDLLARPIPTAPKTSKAPTAPRAAKAQGLSFLGAGGPYTVIAENFTETTTAWDIESVVRQHGAEPITCKIRSRKPVMVVEMAFKDMKGAEQVVSTFDGQLADGQRLSVYIEGQSNATTVEQTVISSREASLPQQSAPASTLAPTATGQSRNTSRRAEEQVVDGRYGFASETNDDTAQGAEGNSQKDQTMEVEAPTSGFYVDPAPADDYNEPLPNNNNNNGFTNNSQPSNQPSNRSSNNNNRHPNDRRQDDRRPTGPAAHYDSRNGREANNYNDNRRSYQPRGPPPGPPRGPGGWRGGRDSWRGGPRSRGGDSWRSSDRGPGPRRDYNGDVMDMAGSGY